jgi:branched-chain amino acid transport system substrate-binding protein
MMRQAITQGGGEILNEVYVPVRAGEASFTDIIEDIKRVKPDAIFSTVVGRGAINFYRAYKKLGGDASSCPIASLTTNEAELNEMGADVAVGHITSAPYFRNLPTKRNQLFKESYRSLFGNITGITSCCEAAYVQMHMFAKALEVVGELNPLKIREQILGAHFEAPQGLVKVDPDNGHTYLHALIAVVDENGEFIIDTRVKRLIKPDPYIVYSAVNDLNLRLQTTKDVK